MPINYNILITYGGVTRKVQKGECIFREGAQSLYYYQLVEGAVKLYSTNEWGKDLVQGYFTAGQGFGEPPLLLERPYPSTAQATEASVIIKIRREGLLNILKDFPEYQQQLLMIFAERIYSKATSAQIWIAHTPEDKIKLFLQKVKDENRTNFEQPVPYTRQQIAHSTGLCTETVIRTLRRMDREGKVYIKNHKLFLK